LLGENRRQGRHKAARPLDPGVEIVIADEEGQYRAAAQGGPSAERMSWGRPKPDDGYWNWPEETAKALKDGWMLPATGASWTRTGSSRRDRVKEMIISAARNIYSVEDRERHRPSTPR